MTGSSLWPAKSAAVSTPSSSKLQICCVVRHLASPILSLMLDLCPLQSLQCRATADPASSEPCDSAVIAGSLLGCLTSSYWLPGCV